MALIDTLRQREGGLKGYSDFEIAQAVAEMYQADTGQSVGVTDVAHELGVQMESRPLAIPDQAGSRPVEPAVLDAAPSITRRPAVTPPVDRPAVEIPVGPVGQARPSIDIPAGPITARVPRVPSPEAPEAPPESSWGDVLIGSAKAGAYGMAAQVGGARRLAGESMTPDDLRVFEAATKDVTLEPEEMAVVALKHAPGPDRQRALNAALEDKKFAVYQQLNREARAGAEQYQENARRAAQNRPNVDPSSAKYYVGAAEEALIGNVLPGLVAGAVTRNPEVGLAVMFGQVYPQKYGEMRQQGYSEPESKAAALFYGLAETVTERVPLGIALKRGVSPYLRIPLAAGTEAPQEMVTEALQIGYDAGVLDQDIDLKTALKRVADAGIVGGMVGTGIGVAGAALDRTPSRSQQIGRVGRDWSRLIDSLEPPQDADAAARAALSPDNAQVQTAPSAAPPAAAVPPLLRPQPVAGGEAAQPVPPPYMGLDRRQDAARRARVSEMTPEEKDRELLISRRAGLWNDRAYEERPRLPAQISIDLDGLKWINDTLGHAAGDQLIRQMGDAIAGITPEGYHISGDEFVVQASNTIEAELLMQRLNAAAQDLDITVQLPDGSTVTKKGLGFSYGIGQDLETAETALQSHKSQREHVGLRAPRGGEPRGVVKTPAPGIQDRQRVPAQQEENVATVRSEPPRPPSRPTNTPVIEFTGQELGGLDLPVHVLRDRARAYARQHFADTAVTNRSDGSRILIPWSGIKHGTSQGIKAVEAVVTSKLDQMLTQSQFVGSAPDEQGRENVKAYHYYEVPVRVAGKGTTIRLVVRETLDGRRYYDHFEVAGRPSPGGTSGERSGSDSLRPAPGEGSATEAADRGIIPDDGEEGPVRSQGPVQGPGTAYQGLISQAYAPGATRPVRSRRVIRREDVLRPLLKALNVPLYQGRVKGRGMERTLGYYLPKREAVRIRKKNDLEVAAHELAHLIDDRVFNGFRVNKNRPNTRPWNPGAHPQWKTFNQELKSVSYDEAKTYEGFAEFIRLWMTQPAAARSKAPAFTRWWENEFVAKHATGPALRQAQKDMTEWYGQQAVDRAASKIGGDDTSKVLADVQDTMWDNGRQAIFDDLHGLWLMETQTLGTRVPSELGPYETARLMRAAHSVVDGALRWGPPKVDSAGRWMFVDREGRPMSFVRDGKVISNPAFQSWGLRDVLAPVAKDLDDWILYAVGRSAQELMGQGREKLFTADEIQGMIDLGRERPHFAKVFADYQRWNKAVLDFAEQMGVIDPQSRARWRREQYLPFYRIGNRGVTKRTKGLEGNITLIHALTGGTGNLNNILDNMVQNATRLIVEGIKNNARLRVVDFANQVQGAGRFLVKIAPDSKKLAVSTSQVPDAMLQALGIDPAQYRAQKKLGGGIPEIDAVINLIKASPLPMVQVWQFNQAPRGDNLIAVLRNGKPEYYEVADPLVYRALASFNRPPIQNAIVRGLNTVRRLGQNTITLTLDFATANLWRDTLHAWAFSPHKFRPVIDSISGMRHRLLRDAVYREFIANGGGMASYLVDPEAFERHLRGFYTKQGIDPRWVLDTPRKLLLGLELLADAAEMSTRLGEFGRAIKAGKSSRSAAMAAREVSVDFAMRGDSEAMNLAYHTIMFLKAGMNSLDRVYRGGFKDASRAHVWAAAGTIALASVALYLLNRGNPDYEDMEDWDKDTNWHLILYRGENGGLSLRPAVEGEQPLFHQRFPKIWEIGALASSAERSMGLFLDSVRDGYSGGAKYAERLGRIFLDLFKLEYMPQAFEPLYEVYALNQNRFTGRDIESPAIQDLEPFARAAPRTSETLKSIAERTAGLPTSLQFSPAKAEALVRGYFNTWGMYGLMLSDKIFHGDTLPEWRTDQWPGIRRFTRSHPLTGTVYEEEFWDLYREAAETHKTLQAMVERNRPEIAERKSLDTEGAMFPALEKVRRAASQINQAITEIYRDPEMSPEEKRAQVDELQTQKNLLFKTVMTEVSAARREITAAAERSAASVSAP